MTQHRRASLIVQTVIETLSAMSNYEVDVLLHPDGADDADRVNAEITLQRAVEAALGLHWRRATDLPEQRIRVWAWDGLIGRVAYVDFDNVWKGDDDGEPLVHPIEQWTTLPSSPKETP